MYSGREQDGFCKEADSVRKLPLAEAVLQVLRFVGHETRLQAIFDRERGRCYDDVIRFPDLVNLVADALLEHGGSGNRELCSRSRDRRIAGVQSCRLRQVGPVAHSLKRSFLTELTRDLRQLFPAKARRESPESLRRLRHRHSGWQGDQAGRQTFEALAQSGWGPLGRPGVGGDAL